MVDSETISLLKHYLDDFFGGHPLYEVAYSQYLCWINTCRSLNVPVREKKCHPPAHSQVILGFEFDLSTMIVRIPKSKLDSIVAKILDFLSRKKSGKVPTVTKVECESLVGSLRWMSTACYGAAAFVRRLELEHLKVSKAHHRVHITASMRKDLKFFLSLRQQLLVGIPMEFVVK